MSSTELLSLSVTGATPRSSAPLTWAQDAIWDAIWGFGEHSAMLNISRTLSIHGRPSITTVLDRLRDACSACEVSATTFHRSEKVQVVEEHAEVPVHLVRSTNATVAQDSHHLLKRLAAIPFRLTTEPPVRLGIVATPTDDVLAAVVVLSHQAFDGTGAALFTQYVETAVRHGAQTAPEPLHPRGLVDLEASPEAQKLNEKHLRSWRRRLVNLPAGIGRRRPAFGSYTRVEKRSAAVAISAQILATRTGCTTSSVLLAGAALCAWGFSPSDAPSAFQVVARNRHYPDLARYLGTVAQNGLMCLPNAAPGTAFEKYLTATRNSAAIGLSHARYDTRQLHDMIERMSADGLAPDLSYLINDARTDPRDWAGLERQGHRLPRLAGRDSDRARVTGHVPMNDATFFLQVAPAGRVAHLRLVCDDALLPPETSAALLDAIEETLAAAALRPGVTLAELAPGFAHARSLE